MQIFVAGKSFMDRATDPELHLPHTPSIADSLNQALDLRKFYEDTATITNRGRQVGTFGDWKHVASVAAPLEQVSHLLDPEWIKNKKRFYAWLRAHPGFKVS